MRVHSTDGAHHLTFSRVERTIFGRPFPGKFRVARVYARLVGLERKPFRGVADVAAGRFWVDTAELTDWGTLFGTFEERELRWLQNHLHGVRHAWDIGAHHGTYAVALARLVGAAGVVHAVEPFPLSIEILRRNVRLNGVESIVDAHECAIADYVGEGSLQLSPHESGNHSLTEALAFEGRTLPVQVTTLDRLQEEFGVPDFVKVDVERGELRVFEGARRLLEFRRTTFLFESELWDDARGEVQAFLRDAGYALSSLKRGREVAGVGARMILARPTKTKLYPAKVD